MTLKEFEEARFSTGKFIIEVEIHKTYKTYGDAQIRITPEVYEWLQLFKISKDSLDLKTEHFFVSHSGKSMDSGAISDRINTQFKNVGVIPEDVEYRIHTNLIRKSTSSGLFDKKSLFTREASVAMMHSEKTQKMHYRLADKDKEIELGTGAIQDLYFPRGIIGHSFGHNCTRKTFKCCYR